MELGFLRNILNDLITRFSQFNLPNKAYLKRELLHLGEYEKELIRKRIISQSYDVGACEVLTLLKDSQIMSVSEYLGNVSDPTELLQIITDIFDDPAPSSALIEEILVENKYEDQVKECLKNYIDDTVQNQEVIQTEMITALEGSLSRALFTSTILPSFLSIVLRHPHEKCSNLIDIISLQCRWNEQFNAAFKLLAGIFEKLMATYATDIVNEIVSLVKRDDDSDVNWFFALMIIGYIKEDTEGYRRVKKLAESQFKKFKTTNNETALYKSLVIARQLFHYSSINATPSSSSSSRYKQFIKSNIGELNYTVKDKAMFINLIDTLQNIVSYENDYQILEHHIKNQLSAPSREYTRVLEYKRLLQSRQTALM